MLAAFSSLRKVVRQQAAHVPLAMYSCLRRVIVPYYHSVMALSLLYLLRQHGRFGVRRNIISLSKLTATGQM